jgi:hypothetical protein
MPFFWVASADASGALIATSAELLSPGPSEVDYPQQPAGRIVDTSAGSRIKQLTPSDPRPRAWVWEMLPTYRASYVRFTKRLESLLGTSRRARGLSPWIYIKDEVTDDFRFLVHASAAATGATVNTLTDSIQNWAVNGLVNGTIEIVSGTGAGQRRSIQSNTATQITVDAWGVQPVAGSVYSLEYSNPGWVRVRVLNVSKRPAAKRAISFESVRMEFVVDDPAWNALG